MADSKNSDSMNKEENQLNGEITGICEQYTEEEEKAVLRKIDTVILPFVRANLFSIFRA
jgi:hypothetical protein